MLPLLQHNKTCSVSCSEENDTNIGQTKSRKTHMFSAVVSDLPQTVGATKAVEPRRDIPARQRDVSRVESNCLLMTKISCVPEDEGMSTAACSAAAERARVRQENTIEAAALVLFMLI